MEAVMFSDVSYKQAALPKLRIARETGTVGRRDSLSSSRTGDSGYNSDPDMSLSPLDFEQVPYTSAAFTFDSSALFHVKEAVSCKPKRLAGNACSSILFKKHPDAQHENAAPKIDVTSAPTVSSSIPTRNKPDWTNAFREPARDSNPTSEPELATSRHDNVEQWISVNLQPQRPQARNSSIVSLSSTGSCDMYSNADDNSDDEDVVNTPSTLSKATLKTIELILRKIEVNLGYAAFMQCAGSQSSKAQGHASTTSRTSRSAPQGSMGKRKARAEENVPPDDPDEDGSSKRRRVSITTTTEDSENGPRFACPFYKHDPTRYRTRRTCPGPGWPTVHRMKEHLYRSHAQPIFCCRCYAMFDSDGELALHQRGTPCPVSAPQPIDGIGRETLKCLRKRSPALRLEEDKWRDTYQLLFPDVADADIPSPYYDTASSPSESSRRFRRELLQRIRRELFASAERDPGPVEQRLLRQVAAIIQRCESELLAASSTSSSSSSFSSSNPSSSAFATTPPASSAAAAAGFLHPEMPTTLRRASAPCILVEESAATAVAPPSRQQSVLQTQTQTPAPPYHHSSGAGQPAYAAAAAAAAASSSFHGSHHQHAPMSPRSGGDATQTFHGVSEEQPPPADDDPPLVAFADPFGPAAFSSSDWIDWGVVFPPGLGDVQVQGGERVEVQMGLAAAGVWT